MMFAVEILFEESSQFRLEICWTEIKLQVFDNSKSCPSKLSVLSHGVKVVEVQVCLGFASTQTKWVPHPQKDWIYPHVYVKTLVRIIWALQSADQDQQCVLAILLYVADTWSRPITSLQSAVDVLMPPRSDAYTAHVISEVSCRTG